MSETSVSFPTDKSAQPDHPIDDVFTKRWSPRAFAARPVDRKALCQILEAARWTMSSYNEQPWRYLVATKEDAEGYENMLGCLNEFNRSWAKSAPVLMLSFARTTFSRNGKPNRCALHDVGAASAALTFQATQLGLYVHQMAGIHTDKAEALYDVPDAFEAVAGLAVGYLGTPDDLSEGLQEREMADRPRQPLADFVFADTWETPASWLPEAD